MWICWRYAITDLGGFWIQRGVIPWYRRLRRSGGMAVGMSSVGLRLRFELLRK